MMTLLSSPLSVTQGRASQRAGTKLVDVYYDVSGGTAPYTVTLEGSSDGGDTWTLPVTSVSGGSGVSAGQNRVITWDAGADWGGEVSNAVSFRVNVTDSAVPPTPDGFALIPAGSFQMGDQSDPLVGYSDERPVHSVYVSAFYMGRYEVTKELWHEVRAWGLSNGYTDLAVGNGSDASKGANHPVHSITWYDMVKWCNARSQKEGLTACYTVGGATYKTGSSAPDGNWSASGYRLPTEAEWEKAARGGLSAKNFPWGDTISHSNANFWNSGGETYQTGTTGPHPTYAVGGSPYSSPVGSFAPNGYRLYDMAGNMWEWCWDGDGRYTAGSQTDPRGASNDRIRVIRGGSWNYAALSTRCAYRNYSRWPEGASSCYGFRLARGQP